MTNLLHPLNNKQAISFDCCFSLEESLSHLSKYVKSSSISAGLDDSLIGKVSADQVKIWNYRRLGLGQSGVVSAFYGKFIVLNGKTKLTGEFRLEKGSKYVFWGSIVGITIFWMWVAMRDLNHSSTISDIAIYPAALLFCIAGMIVYLLLGWRSAKKDIDYLQSAIGNILSNGNI